MNEQQNLEFKLQLRKFQKIVRVQYFEPRLPEELEVKNEKRKIFNYLKKQYIIQYIDYRLI